VAAVRGERRGAVRSSGLVVQERAARRAAALGNGSGYGRVFRRRGDHTGLCADFVYSSTGDGEEIPGTFTSPDLSLETWAQWAR
jgi:hypothetical protein